MSKVVIYTTSWCGYCHAARRVLRDKGIEFSEIDLTEDADARRALNTRTGQRTVPQIFIGELHVGGYTDLRALDRSGQLDALLAV